MYENQYLISNFVVNLPEEEFLSFEFIGLHFYVNRKLNYVLHVNGGDELCLLGFMVDPFEPLAKNQDVVMKLNRRINDIESAIRMTAKLPGRYVLIFKVNGSIFSLTDPCAFRQLYYAYQDAQLVLSSSPKMIMDAMNWIPQIAKEVTSIIKSRWYKKAENFWQGDQWYDKRIKKVMPNHFLDINKRMILRNSAFFELTDVDEDPLAYAKNNLKGSLSAISQRYHVIQPITAGWDSRVLLAASKPIKDKVQYYVFQTNLSPRAPDIRVPEKLSKELGIKFSIIHTDKLKGDFLSIFRKEHIFPRILPKTRNIQYHYLNHRHQNIININGNGGEVVRCYYGIKEIVDIPQLIHTIHLRFRDYLAEELAQWYSEAIAICKNHGISVLDLFYWEQRMGNWGALYPFEQDIAIEEFSPFNNRNLLLSLLKVEKSRRQRPNFKFFGDLILSMWPEVLCQPINPVWGAKRRFKSTAKRILNSVIKRSK